MAEPGATTLFGAFTAVGHVREHNEDAWLADEALGLWVVADGMGGHAAGEVASRMACDAIQQAIAEGKDLVAAIEQAQVELAAAIESGEGSEGMGTTVVAVKAEESRYQIAWVGDSRAYLWHDGQLRQLTHDHSFVQELLDSQAISADEAEKHPEKSTLSRCLGGGLDEILKVDEISARFFAGERIILCTDGVSGEISDADFQACLREYSEEAPSEIAEALVQRALDAGGNDNATALVIAAPPDAPDRIRQTAPRRSVELQTELVGKKRSRKITGLIIAAFGALLLAGVAWYYLNSGDPKSPPQAPPQGFLESNPERAFVNRDQLTSHPVTGD